MGNRLVRFFLLCVAGAGIVAVFFFGTLYVLNLMDAKSRGANSPAVASQLQKALHDVPTSVAQRAQPIFDWLTAGNGIQSAERINIVSAAGPLVIDIDGIDMAGCRAIFKLSRSAGAPIARIAVSGASGDEISVPTKPADEEQCARGTNFLRMIK
jgi:hypothetical protein